jgi:hypothetical protein
MYQELFTAAVSAGRTCSTRMSLSRLMAMRLGSTNWSAAATHQMQDRTPHVLDAQETVALHVRLPA